jgi:peptidoglycan hydrolase CwlO-like protein
VLEVGAAIVKDLKRHKWIGAAMALVLGAGGSGAVAYTTSDRAKANELNVTHLQEATTSLEPRVKKTELDIQSIKTSVAAIATSNKSIAGGIEELKEENVKRLEKELEAKEREIRRLERLARER